MAVLIGSARSNEYGGVNGGKAGDQKSGEEVSMQNWYLHNKGWVVIRAKDAAIREKIAYCMEVACKNNHIGYCQDHRTALWDAAKQYDFDAGKVTKDVETDCSALVRVCCRYAGILVGDFTTASEAAILNATGLFEIIRDATYCNSSDRLLRGDILVTKTKGHTVVVLSNGTGVGNKATTMSVDSARGYLPMLSGKYKTTADLHIRVGAGTSKTSQGVLPNGTEVRCYGYYTPISGVNWLLVQTPGYTGFCSSKYLQRT